MSATLFAAQLRLVRVTAEFHSAYVRYVTALVAKEQERLRSVLGADAAAVRALGDLGRPLSHDELEALVRGMTVEQRDALAAAVTGDE